MSFLPATIEGIGQVEFYVSADGKTVAASQRVLAQLCGVSKTAIQKLMSGANFVSTLEAETPTHQGIQLLTPCQVCEIIEHFAFNSKRANPITQYKPELTRLSTLGDRGCFFIGGTKLAG